MKTKDTKHIEALAKGLKKVSPNNKLLKDFRDKFKEIQEEDELPTPRPT